MKAEKIGDGMVVVEGIRYVNENRPRVLTCMEHEDYKKLLSQGESLPIDNISDFDCNHRSIMYINSKWKYFCLKCGCTGIESSR